MWKKNPHCENCKRLTVLPEDVPYVIGSDGKRKIKVVPDHMATIQHKYSRLSPLRRKRTTDRRLLLWCHKCNYDDHLREQAIYKPTKKVTKMKKSKTSISVGAGFLVILLVILKLEHVINWSWWWVFSPLWLPIAIVIVLYLLISLFL